METKEFLDLAKERYGDKIYISKITYQSTKLKSLDKDFISAVEDYPKKAWIMNNKCPECDAELRGLFSVFTWGIIHGIGFCGNCKKVEFELYHYPLEGSNERFVGLALCGFPKPKK